jgi:hypothetical protein
LSQPESPGLFSTTFPTAILVIILRSTNRPNVALKKIDLASDRPLKPLPLGDLWHISCTLCLFVVVLKRVIGGQSHHQDLVCEEWFGPVMAIIANSCWHRHAFYQDSISMEK